MEVLDSSNTSSGVPTTISEGQANSTLGSGFRVSTIQVPGADFYFWLPLCKILLPLFIVICFVFSLHFTDGKTSIVIRELGVRDGVYAGTYVHGAPLPHYRTGAESRAVRDVWKLKARRGNALNNYANRYKNWSPHLDKHKLPGKDVQPFLKGRRPFPQKYRDNDVFHSRRPNRPHKKKLNNLERPAPPHDDLDSDDYFPEETKRAEAQYEYGVRGSVKKRRIPFERRKKPKKPYSKPHYDDDDRRVVFEDDRKVHYKDERPDVQRKKPKRPPSISYSTFIQHSPGPEVDYDYADEEDVRPYRKKKRRIKKKTNKPREEEEVDEYRSPQEIYGHLPVEEEYDASTRNKVKLKKYKPDPQPVYGEGHISHQNLPYPTSNIFRTQEDYSSPLQSSQKVQTYNLPQVQSITNPYRPSYDSSPYSQSIQYTKITQPSQDFSNAYNLNGGNYVPGTYSSVTTYESLVPSSSTNPYYKYKNYQEEPIIYSPSLSYQKDVSTSYKTSPAYDSTDTFKDFNSNAGGQKKYSTYSSKYSEGSGIFSSVHYSERPDQENEFLQKHQNLYNNGISGVPVQGDGYSNKDNKKDYDIGYGEFQFDENPV